jgi:hypothetical protein
MIQRPVETACALLLEADAWTLLSSNALSGVLDVERAPEGQGEICVTDDEDRKAVPPAAGIEVALPAGIKADGGSDAFSFDSTERRRAGWPIPMPTPLPPTRP